MRYSNIDLQCTDIMWFGIDIEGHIAAFTSGGEAFVPEFVCRSKSETELLENFFLNQLEASTQYILAVEEKDNYLIRDSKILSSKGLFCFDVSSAKDIDYELISHPQTPLSMDDLPTEIIIILQSHRMRNSFTNTENINIDRLM